MAEEKEAKFTLVSLPESNLSFKNQICLHPSDLRSLFSSPLVFHAGGPRLSGSFPPQIVTVQGRHFLAGESDKINQGEVAMSSVNRDWIKQPEVGGAVKIQTSRPLRDIYVVSMTVEYIPLKSGRVPKYKLAESALLEDLKALGRVPLTVGQTVALRHRLPFLGAEEFAYLYAKVTALELAAEDDAKQANEGLISEDMLCDMTSEGPQLTKMRKPKKKLNLQDIGIGALSAEFEQIFRRAFSTRSCDPSLVEEMGVKHQKGMLLYGPPGTGKTLIARQIGKLLSDKEPVVVNGPEILDKWVGSAEAKIRELFAPAEQDLKDNGVNAELHIIIFDEIDSIAKHRGSTSGGTGVADTIVNMLLTKLDGVKAITNVLVIGLTNRKDMIDPAVLRPGRLGVHVEIGLPDQHGREEILQIHTSTMRKNNRLDPLVNIPQLAERTKNFVGAELEALVQSAASHAMYDTAELSLAKGGQATISKQDVFVTNDHFERALVEVVPRLGNAEKNFKDLLRGDIIEFSPQVASILYTNYQLIQRLQAGSSSLLTVLFHGPQGAGMTALAAKVALDAQCPFTKVISPDAFGEFSEAAKCSAMRQMFEDAYRSTLSVVILDGLEQLLEYVPLGARFSSAVLSTLTGLLKKPPPVGRKLVILATTSDVQLLKALRLLNQFSMQFEVPRLTAPSHLSKVFSHLKLRTEGAQLEEISHGMLPISIKPLLLLLNLANRSSDGATSIVTAASLLEVYQNSNLQMS